LAVCSRVLKDVTVCLPSHWLCKPALFAACSKPVEIGRVAAERAFGVIMGNDGGGAPIVWMGLHPGRLSVCLPLQHNIHKWTSSDGGS